jgi:hypothetical protein
MAEADLTSPLAYVGRSPSPPFTTLSTPALPDSASLPRGHKVLGKAFAECHTRHTSHGKLLDGKEMFVECFLSGTRQSLCWVPSRPSAKKSDMDGDKTVMESLPSARTARHSAKTSYFFFEKCFAECHTAGTRQSPRFFWKMLCRVPPWRHSAKTSFFLKQSFAECCHADTRQRWRLCRVLWSMHSAKHVPKFPGWATLPSAMALTLDKGCLCRLQHTVKWPKPTNFFCFLHSNQINSTYITLHIICGSYRQKQPQ